MTMQNQFPYDQLDAERLNPNCNLIVQDDRYCGGHTYTAGDLEDCADDLATETAEQRDGENRMTTSQATTISPRRQAINDYIAAIRSIRTESESRSVRNDVRNTRAALQKFISDPNGLNAITNGYLDDLTDGEVADLIEFHLMDDDIISCGEGAKPEVVGQFHFSVCHECHQMLMRHQREAAAKASA
jgi:hypothetical protein